MSDRKMPLLIRADATPHSGSGHIMRCRALAAAASQAGMLVLMGGHCSIAWLRPLLEAERYIFFDNKCSIQESPADLLAQLQYMAEILSFSTIDCAVVLDGYHFTHHCHSAVRNKVRTLLILDDYHHLPYYDCDILLNQNPGSEEYIYEGNTRVKLMGLDYVLLRPEFLHPPPPSGRRDTLLLSLGGGDFSSLLPALGLELSGTDLSGKILRVLAADVPPDTFPITLGHSGAHLEILPRVDNMPNLLADTEICISAGGSTCWELCRMGVPFLTLEVAENQHNICNWLELHDYASRFSTSAFNALLSDRALRNKRSSALRVLVDGRGAERVLSHLWETYTMRY